MKKLLIATILTITAFQSAFAQVDQSGTTIEHYQYGDNLDVAKVLEIDTPVDVCAVVTSHMIYLDSKGTKHNLEYNIMGNGCSNG